MQIEKDIINTTLSESLIEQIKNKAEKLQLLKRELSRHVVGNNETINLMLFAMLCNGHILLEGVPGVAKTTMIRSFAELLGLNFKRIQFTPDLLPSDLIGTVIYNSKTQNFETKRGPIFSNIVLADEINRAPAKVQSALLESMQEHQVTIGSETHKLEEPFFVFATQNPVEQEGTYQLPEAQLDRFLFKAIVGYPAIEDELKILKLKSVKKIESVVSRSDILESQKLVESIYMDEKISQYIVNIVWATRDPEKLLRKEVKNWISLGASPRATIAMYHSAKAHAFLNKRHFVIPDDVKAIAIPVLRHRIIQSYEAQDENITTDFIAQTILDSITTP